MLVKIDGTIFDSTKRPIMIILSEEEKTHIANMGEATKYCVAPDDMTQEELEAFMQTE